jgi:hypothetical protein
MRRSYRIIDALAGIATCRLMDSQQWLLAYQSRWVLWSADAGLRLIT